MNYNEILKAAAQFEKLAAEADMGTPQEPNIGGIISNLKKLMPWAREMSKAHNSVNTRLRKLESKAHNA